MQTHELKIWPPFFEHMLLGEKTFDARLNDRHFRVGDEIKFREWLPHEEAYTGRNVWMRVKYVLNPRPDRDPDCGLVAGYVVLGLEHINLGSTAA